MLSMYSMSSMSFHAIPRKEVFPASADENSLQNQEQEIGGESGAGSAGLAGIRRSRLCAPGDLAQCLTDAAA